MRPTGARACQGEPGREHALDVPLRTTLDGGGLLGATLGHFCAPLRSGDYGAQVAPVSDPDAPIEDSQYPNLLTQDEFDA